MRIGYPRLGCANPGNASFPFYYDIQATYGGLLSSSASVSSGGYRQNIVAVYNIRLENGPAYGDYL
jgi:hypothetical protein